MKHAETARNTPATNGRPGAHLEAENGGAEGFCSHGSKNPVDHQRPQSLFKQAGGGGGEAAQWQGASCCSCFREGDVLLHALLDAASVLLQIVLETGDAHAPLPLCAQRTKAPAVWRVETKGESCWREGEDRGQLGERQDQNGWEGMRCMGNRVRHKRRDKAAKGARR